MTEDQKAQLEDLYNEYSYAKETSEKGGMVAARAIQGMWALEDAVDIFGYRFKYKETESRDGKDYLIYRLIRKTE